MKNKELRNTLQKLASQRLQRSALEKKAEFPGLKFLAPTEYGPSELDKGEIAKYLLTYGGGGALLGGGVGALIGGKASSAAGGALTGALGGTALGALALNKRMNRNADTSKSLTGKYDAPNWASELAPELGISGLAGGLVGATATPGRMAGVESLAGRMPKGTGWIGKSLSSIYNWIGSYGNKAGKLPKRIQSTGPRRFIKGAGTFALIQLILSAAINKAKSNAATRLSE